MTKISDALLFDADVLIDFQNSDFTILSEVSKYIGDIYTTSRVVKEVDGLDLELCQQVGLEVIIPERRIVKLADRKIGQLSKSDRISLLTAVDLGLNLVTNDSDFRKACKKRSVRTIRGLRLLLNLVEKSDYPIKNIKEIVEMIQESNYIHISSEIVDEFYKELEKIRKV